MMGTKIGQLLVIMCANILIISAQNNDRKFSSFTVPAFDDFVIIKFQLNVNEVFVQLVWFSYDSSGS